MMPMLYEPPSEDVGNKELAEALETNEKQARTLSLQTIEMNRLRQTIEEQQKTISNLATALKEVLIR